MSDRATPNDDQGVNAEADEIDADEIEIDDEALEVASGGQMLNSTEIVYASTFVPFDSSF